MAQTDAGAARAGSGIRWLATGLSLIGLALVLVLLWEVFFWVNTESTMGVVQRIFYVHVPSMWTAFFAFGLAALCSAVYLWLGDERLDWAAVSAAEGGLLFTTAGLVTGSLWGKIAWGTFWTWEPRLTSTLLLWFIYLGYFVVRRSTENPERARRFAAVVAIVGALDIPIIHVSVLWFRSLHPQPVVLNTQKPMNLERDMGMTLTTGLLAFTLLFLGILAFRFGLERSRAQLDLRLRRGGVA
ncbi:MAG: cytochrome C assembly protein [Gemmatimonadetes bacterium]|nr:cytochrome C assembly protein [Gemmatimonadota bacterium]